MSETSYDSVLVGYTEDRTLDDGQHIGYKIRFKDHELVEMAKKYATSRNEKGEGGDVYLKIFRSKNDKPCCSVFDPNSAAAKKKREERQASKETTDDLPF